MILNKIKPKKENKKNERRRLKWNAVLSLSHTTQSKKRYFAKLLNKYYVRLFFSSRQNEIIFFSFQLYLHIHYYRMTLIFPFFGCITFLILILILSFGWTDSCARLNCLLLLVHFFFIQFLWSFLWRRWRDEIHGKRNVSVWQMALNDIFFTLCLPTKHLCKESRSRIKNHRNLLKPTCNTELYLSSMKFKKRKKYLNNQKRNHWPPWRL